MDTYPRNMKAVKIGGLLCAALISVANMCAGDVAGMSKETRAVYERLENTSWSLNGFPCNKGGGTFVDYGDHFKDGFRHTFHGVVQEASKAPSKIYFVQSEELGEIKLLYEYYANETLLEMGFPANGVTARGFRAFSFEGKLLIEEHYYQSIDLDAFLRNSSVSYEPIKSETVERTPC